MEEPSTTLFIGRFQPFHRGHLDAIEQIFAHTAVKTLLVGIGSAEESWTMKNPFTAGERFQMIDANMRQYFPEKKVHILPLRDIHRAALWPQHVIDLLPPFASVWSGSSYTLELFRQYAPQIACHQLQLQKEISATKVRGNLLQGADTSALLTPETEAILENIDAQKRLKTLS